MRDENQGIACALLIAVGIVEQRFDFLIERPAISDHFASSDRLVRETTVGAIELFGVGDLRAVESRGHHMIGIRRATGYVDDRLGVASRGDREDARGILAAQIFSSISGHLAAIACRFETGAVGQEGHKTVARRRNPAPDAAVPVERHVADLERGHRDFFDDRDRCGVFAVEGTVRVKDVETL